jgi:hypothetical protein
LTPFSKTLPVCFLAVLAAGSNAICAEQKPGASHRTSHMTDEEKSAIASELTSVIEQYIEAGQMTDPRDRSKYLAPKVFYFGHALTRQQAEREINSLYRRWPARKFGRLEEPEIFAVPKKRDVYKVTGTYEYDLANLGEHLSGKSKITCVLEHSSGGTRIIGLDEKLISDTTKYFRD